MNLRNLQSVATDHGQASHAMTYDTEQFAACAIIIFSGNSGLWLLRWLAPHYRHCFAILPISTNLWLWINPLAHAWEWQVIDSSKLIITLASLVETGHRLMPARLPATPPLLQGWAYFYHQTFGLLRPFSCVSMVQRLLHLPAPLYLTPAKLAQKLRSLWLSQVG